MDCRGSFVGSPSRASRDLISKVDCNSDQPGQDRRSQRTLTTSRVFSSSLQGEAFEDRLADSRLMLDVDQHCESHLNVRVDYGRLYHHDGDYHRNRRLAVVDMIPYDADDLLRVVRLL